MKGRKPLAQSAKHHKLDLPLGVLEATCPPDWFSDRAATVWFYTLQNLAEAGHAIPIHNSEIFVGFCLSAAAAREADEILGKEGLTVNDGRAGTRRHPLISVRSQALLQLRSCAESLGLTPASAARLPFPPVAEERNEFADA